MGEAGEAGGRGGQPGVRPRSILHRWVGQVGVKRRKWREKPDAGVRGVIQGRRKGRRLV